MSEPSRTWIHIHIPKTAGTALYRAAARRFGKKNVFHFPNKSRLDARFGTLSGRNDAISDYTDTLNDSQAVIGHFCFGAHQHLSGPYFYSTLLREPVDRLWSMYWFADAGKVVTRPSINDYFCTIDRPSRYGFYGMDNLQTRMLAGGKPDLELAKSNLSECAVVGLVEAFDTFLDELRNAGVALKVRVERRTKRKPRDIDPEFRRLALLSESLDSQLYDFAKELLS